MSFQRLGDNARYIYCVQCWFYCIHSVDGVVDPCCEFMQSYLSDSDRYQPFIEPNLADEEEE